MPTAPPVPLALHSVKVLVWMMCSRPGAVVEPAQMAPACGRTDSRVGPQSAAQSAASQGASAAPHGAQQRVPVLWL